MWTMMYEMVGEMQAQLAALKRRDEQRDAELARCHTVEEGDLLVAAWAAQDAEAERKATEERRHREIVAALKIGRTSNGPGLLGAGVLGLILGESIK